MPVDQFPHLVCMISGNRNDNGLDKRRSLDSPDRMNQERQPAYFKELLGKIGIHPPAGSAGGYYCGSCGHNDQKRLEGVISRILYLARRP